MQEGVAGEFDLGGEHVGVGLTDESLEVRLPVSVHSDARRVVPIVVCLVYDL